MFGLDDHSTYIALAYIGVAIVSFGMIAATLVNAQAKKQRLAELEASGVRRRSGKNKD